MPETVGTSPSPDGEDPVGAEGAEGAEGASDSLGPRRRRRQNPTEAARDGAIVPATPRDREEGEETPRLSRFRRVRREYRRLVRRDRTMIGDYSTAAVHVTFYMAATLALVHYTGYWRPVVELARLEFKVILVLMSFATVLFVFEFYLACKPLFFRRRRGPPPRTARSRDGRSGASRRSRGRRSWWRTWPQRRRVAGGLVDSRVQGTRWPRDRRRWRWRWRRRRRWRWRVWERRFRVRVRCSYRRHIARGVDGGPEHKVREEDGGAHGLGGQSA